MLSNSNYLNYLNESKKIGGILGFVSSNDNIIIGLSSNDDFFKFMFNYIENNLNHFYYFFLGNFEKKIRNEIVNNTSFNKDRFLILLHLEIYNIYNLYVYGREKELILSTNKSIHKTIERILKNYDPLYLLYLKEKGYGQLAELCFDIYLYYSFLGCQFDEYHNFIKKYKHFLEFEWQPMNLEKINRPINWDYNCFFRVEQNHNIY